MLLIGKWEWLEICSLSMNHFFRKKRKREMTGFESIVGQYANRKLLLLKMPALCRNVDAAVVILFVRNVLRLPCVNFPVKKKPARAKRCLLTLKV